MDVRRHTRDTKDMFNTGRRSAISTSELGLYSDHSDNYNNSHYSATVRKLVIGIMVVVSAILIGIFLYDFASSASISSKVSQETKHIYILQNSLRKPSLVAKKSSVTIAPTIYIVNSSNSNTYLEDRSDDNHDLEFQDQEAIDKSPDLETRTQRMAMDEPESRTQNLKNFKIRNSMLDKQNEDDVNREKPAMNNHAMIYRVRLKLPPNLSNDRIETNEGSDESNENDNQRATPFRFELKGPHPASFKRSKYPQLSQYRYPHASRNIQDIIKYLTNDPETLNRGIKFTGFYVNPKKYDNAPTDIGEVAMNSDRSEEQESAPYAIAFNTDPLYQYKPKHPSDVNLLAPNNFRFSPIGLHRYNPYFDPYYQRPNPNKQNVYQENQYDNVGAYDSSGYGKKRQPKPFSVMLDIYPITDNNSEPSKKSTQRLKSQMMMDDPHTRRQIIPLLRNPKYYGIQSQTPYVMATQAPEEEEKHQMILHLNLYPKKKSKLTRNDVIERSETLAADEKEELINKMIRPFDAITKHLTDHAAVEEAKLDERVDLGDSLKVRYEETPLDSETLRINKKDLNAEMEKDIKAEKLIATTQINDCKNNCEITTFSPETTTATMATTIIAATTNSVQTTTLKNEKTTKFTDIDTVEGFQQFADSLIAMD